jgi:hypothetical protein
MKKNGLFVARIGMICIGILFLSNCASTIDLGIYDTEFPKNQQSTIILDGKVVVLSIDGDTVNWHRGGKDSEKTKVVIPSGNHTFNTVVARFNVLGAVFGGLAGGFDYLGSAYELSYNFQPNMTYQFKAKGRSVEVAPSK